MRRRAAGGRHQLWLAATLMLVGACSRGAPAGALPGGEADASVRWGRPVGSTALPSPAVAAAPSGASAAASSGAGPTSFGADEQARAGLARQQLVHEIATVSHPWGGEPQWDLRVLDAMRRVERHRFMPGVSIATAYQDTAYPIGHEQTISQPSLVAVMTQALRLSGRERVLEIGTGSGYQAAVLSLLAAEVDSIEIVRPLGEQARRRLSALGYHNVRVRIGDGYQGWPERAPFDRILLTASPPSMPAELVKELADGGILVAPVGKREQQLVRWTRRGRSMRKETLGPVVFVPMVPGGR